MSDAVVEELRGLAPQVVGVLTRRYGAFDAAEDAVQEALVTAAERWTRDGIPETPRGWLVRTASRRLIDQLRADRSRRARETLVALREPPPGIVSGEDDSLALLFLCCHPALTPTSAVALTLRAVGGLSTREIARAFLVPEATMAQRISRAKAAIASSGATFEMPAAADRPARVRAVGRVLYLMFNEGYAAASGDQRHRTDLSDEAIRLTRTLRAQLPDDGEVAGLLALMLLVDARRAARTDPAGRPVPLGDQDRSLWDRALIAEGTALLDGAMGGGPVGEYRIQAAIAAVHARAARAEDTEWPQILGLYGLLARVTGNPVVTLNQAVARGMVDGPDAGLVMLDDVAGALRGHHRLDAVRAHLLELAGDTPGAIAHYRRAAERTTNLADRHALIAAAARLRQSGG